MNYYTSHRSFIQPMPVLGDVWAEDLFLQDYLSAYLPHEILEEARPSLERLGERAAGVYRAWAEEAERDLPEHIPYNAWGERVDEIRVSPAWTQLHRAAAEEGLIAMAYERKWGAHSRVLQMASLYMYTPSSAIYTCPLAMTDGAARLIECIGDDFSRQHILPRLMSRDPNLFQTCGQWMTERTGGSDLQRAMTAAHLQSDGSYLLYGHKWFTSAITADYAFTLASVVTENGIPNPLTLFYLPIRLDGGRLNGIIVEGLKDKLGTKALPTAQLQLEGCRAFRLGDLGKGVKNISILFNITRIYNAISAVSYMRRAYAMTEAYSRIRESFGKPLKDHVLYHRSLMNLAYHTEGHLLLLGWMSRLLGKEEYGTSSQSERLLLRLLTPIAKLFTAKRAVQSASEHIELMGGIGYLEDSHIPVLLRNAQVLTIWEGTTQVLALDMLRAMAREESGLAWVEWIEEQTSRTYPEACLPWKDALTDRWRRLSPQMDTLKNPTEALTPVAVELAYFIAEFTIGWLWLDFFSHSPGKIALYGSHAAFWIKRYGDPKKWMEDDFA